MKNKETLILHDYFDNFGGGERLVNILGDELNSNIVTGFINSQYKHLLNNNIINLNIFFKSNRYLKISFLFFRFYFFKINHCPKNVIFSGCYSVFSIRRFKSSRKILYHHTLPKFAYYNESKPYSKSILFGYFINFMRIIFKKIYEKSLLHTDIIFCNSHFTKNELLNNINIKHKKIYVIYPPVDLNVFNIKNTSYGNYFVVNSRHECDKKIDLIIKSFNSLSYKLFITGSGSKTAKLKILAKNNSNIVFLGTLNETEYIKILKNCRATILLSENEDFGMALAESLACGKMVFCLKSGGFVEYLQEGKNCVFLNKNDIINNLIDNINFNFEKLEGARDCCYKTALKFSKKNFINAFRDHLIYH